MVSIVDDCDLNESRKKIHKIKYNDKKNFSIINDLANKVNP